MPRKSKKAPESEPPEKQLNDVFIRVFLTPSTRKKFRIACAQEECSMSQKGRWLIEQWISGLDDELP